MAEEMKQDTTVTWNWFRMNVPTIIAVASIGLYINNGLLEAKKDSNNLQIKLAEISGRIEPLQGVPYRIEQAEKNIIDTNNRVDKLSNTIINSIDLIRRDVGRLTTQVEVLSSQIGMLAGDEPKMPKQRRARPGGPLDEDQP